MFEVLYFEEFKNQKHNGELYHVFSAYNYVSGDTQRT